MDELQEVSEVEPIETTLEYHPDLFSSIVDPEKEHPIWSILTETITYVKDKNEQQTGCMPSEGYEFTKWKEKRDLIKNPNNFPYAELGQFEDKYTKV